MLFNKKLRGLESKDIWGNKTEITSVDYDTVTIATYRSHSHPTCVSRSIWRSDAYEKDIQGGIERMAEEFKICGFNLWELVYPDFIPEHINKSNEGDKPRAIPKGIVQTVQFDTNVFKPGMAIKVNNFYAIISHVNVSTLQFCHYNTTRDEMNTIVITPQAVTSGTYNITPIGGNDYD